MDNQSWEAVRSCRKYTCRLVDRRIVLTSVMVPWFLSVSVGTILSWVGEEEDKESSSSLYRFYYFIIFSTIVHLIRRVFTTLYYLEKNKKLEAFCNFKCIFHFLS